MITTDIAGWNDQVQPVDLECSGVRAGLLDVPPALTEDWEEALKLLGLTQARSIEVWPAGLGAAAWDGDGAGEWLAMERPCLAIRTDHPVGSLFISVDGTTKVPLDLASAPPGEPLFVEFPDLSLGQHRIGFYTAVGPLVVPDPLGELDVLIRIREPRAPVDNEPPLFEIQVDPPCPTLDQLWEAEISIQVDGPGGYPIRGSVSLFENSDTGALITTSLPTLRMPVTPQTWRAHFLKYFRETKAAQENYDSAREGCLELNGDELGRFELRCYRELAPLRWSSRVLRRNNELVLIDDSGSDEPPEVCRFDFETPTVPHQLAFYTKYPVAREGGLYLARRKGTSAAIIVPPAVHGLADLRCMPRIEDHGDHSRSVENVVELVEFAMLWRSARASGNPLSSRNQGIVLRSLGDHIAHEICGSRWAQAERIATGSEAGITDLKRAVSRHKGEWGAPAALVLEVDRLSRAPLSDRVSRLAEVLVSFRIIPSNTTSNSPTQNPVWLAELALRLASDPGTVRTWGKGYSTLGIRRLIEELPTVARVARFIVIVTNRHLQSDTILGEPYAGWKWS